MYQPTTVINAPKILDLNQLINGLPVPASAHGRSLTPRLSEAHDNPDLLSEEYPPTDKHIPVGDLFTSCNWVLRDGYVDFRILSVVKLR